jgi:hypothetical protein
MNTQDYRNLQEAYMEVYEQEKGRGPRISDFYDLQDNNPAESGGPKGGGTIKGPKRKNVIRKEEVDIYDIILSHLLDEGYAETPEAAEVIMVNMSEEWKQSIITEVSKAEFDAGMKAAAIQMSRERPTYTPTPDQLDHFGQLNKNKKPLPPDKRKPGGIYADPPINTRKGSDPYQNLSVGVPIAGLN